MDHREVEAVEESMASLSLREATGQPYGSADSSGIGDSPSSASGGGELGLGPADFSVVSSSSSSSKAALSPPSRDGGVDATCTPSSTGSPSPRKATTSLALLMERNRCSIVQQAGQRRYGPPEDWPGDGPPPKGSEVFVGKIPRDCFEDELVPALEQAGTVYEMRLMMEFAGMNRGYAFVVYSSPSEAKECVRTLNGFEIRRGKMLGVCMSVDNCRLFVGGIPKKASREDMKIEMVKISEGVVDVILYPSAADKSKNRGFAFVQYETHRAAAMARRKLMNSRVQIWGQAIAVDWAEPECEVDEEIMAQVCVCVCV